MAQQSWDRNAAKNLFRLTCQRLGQLQEKNDSQANITRGDISTLLHQHNVSLARAKAQKLLQDDAFGDVLEILGMHTGILTEHVHELDPTASPSPVVVEAASTVIYAASHVDLKDLHMVRDLLVQRLGEAFAASALNNRDRYVSPRAVASLSPPPPSATTLDICLLNIAKAYGVSWLPEPRRQDIINELSELLDSGSSPLVDVPRLRQLCSRGIPDHPSWLRPRIWKILFGILPVLKASWSKEMNIQRNSYYDLVRRLLGPFETAPPPTTPSSSSDNALLEVSRQLSRIPPALFSALAEEPEPSPLCPLDDSCNQENKITCANALQLRLHALQTQGATGEGASDIPEIRLEFESVEPSSSLSRTTSLSRRVQPPPLLTSKSLSEKAHDKHMAALGRILYIHSVINPGNSSPHIPTLVLPIYTAMLEEFELEDAAHVEADTFWIFESLVSEFSELEDEQGGTVWMKRLAERLEWADPDLQESLDRKGLNPALPHYSYRWLAPILAHTFSMSDTLVAWDAIFARAPRQRDGSPRLEFLVDICAAMLIRARVALLRLGKNVPKSPGLWGHEEEWLPPPSPLRSWELGDAFLEGMTLLQNYPLSGAGGIDSVLQSASDLWNRRQDEAKAAKTATLSLGERLKVTMWKGFTNQVASSPDRSPAVSDGEESDHEPDTAAPPENKEDALSVTIDPTPGLTSRLANTLWKGITNQSSMEPPPSPMSPMSPAIPDSHSSPATPPNDKTEDSGPSLTTSLWGYAGKLKDSDTAANLAKVSSNWRAKALSGSWSLRTSAKEAPPPLPEQFLSPPSHHRHSPAPSDNRRGSLPGPDRTGVYSPPTRPAYFRPPRDSIIFPSGGALSVPASPDAVINDLTSRTHHIQESIASLTKTSTKKSGGPRPLLLNPSSLITDHRTSVVEAKPPVADQWSEVTKMKKGHGGRKDSQSSMSSLAPADALRSTNLEYDSDRSRRVMLNRKSVSPMAPHFRGHHQSWSSSGTSPDHGISHLAFNRGDIVINGGNTPGRSPVVSPSLYYPPPLPVSPALVGISDPEGYGDRPSDIIEPLDTPSIPRKLSRKKTPPSRAYEDTSDSSAIETPSKSPRVRPRRQMNRPSALQLQEVARPMSLGVPWPDDEGHTPKAASFDGADAAPARLQRRTRKVSAESPYEGAVEGRTRKVSGESRTRKISGESRTRKVSGEARTRKVSTETYRPSRKVRDSAAEEGDDEGYDDLLSAYETDDSPKTFFPNDSN